MTPNKPIPEHIQIISQLMQRAPLHRTITTPVFFIIGLVALLLGTGLTFKAGRHIDLHTFPFSTGFWITVWLIAGLSIVITAYALAARHAKAQHQPLDTPQLRHVFRSLVPALIFGLAVGISLSFHNIQYLPLTASIWISSYGLALFSIRLYTTKSARFLSILMLALGIACSWVSLRTMGEVHPIHLANFFMCLAFGVFHCIVAAGSLLFQKAGI